MSPDQSFNLFWKAWPSNCQNYTRKGSKIKCQQVWGRLIHLDLDHVLNHIAWLKTTDSWKDGYIPAPLVYLNQRRWDGAEIPKIVEHKLSTDVEKTQKLLAEKKSYKSKPPEWWGENVRNLKERLRRAASGSAPG